MQVWPSQFEEYLYHNGPVSLAALDDDTITLQEYIKIVSVRNMEILEVSKHKINTFFDFVFGLGDKPSTLAVFGRGDGLRDLLPFSDVSGVLKWLQRSSMIFKLSMIFKSERYSSSPS